MGFAKALGASDLAMRSKRTELKWSGFSGACHRLQYQLLGAGANGSPPVSDRRKKNERVFIRVRFF